MVLSISHMRNEGSLTENVISDTEPAMGRKKHWAEDMVARFPAGTFARIRPLLDVGEDRTDFVREAVKREIARREKTAAKSEATK